MNEDEIDLLAHDWDGDEWSPEELERAEIRQRLENEYADYARGEGNYGDEENRINERPPAEVWNEDEIRRINPAHGLNG